jgi:hypothetical protein
VQSRSFLTSGVTLSRGLAEERDVLPFPGHTALGFRSRAHPARQYPIRFMPVEEENRGPFPLRDYPGENMRKRVKVKRVVLFSGDHQRL